MAPHPPIRQSMCIVEVSASLEPKERPPCRLDIGLDRPEVFPGTRRERTRQGRASQAIGRDRSVLSSPSPHVPYRHGGVGSAHTGGSILPKGDTSDRQRSQTVPREHWIPTVGSVGVAGASAGGYPSTEFIHRLENQVLEPSRAQGHPYPSQAWKFHSRTRFAERLRSMNS